MKASKELLQLVEHRPYLLPKGQWDYYQEWDNALFLHWKLPAEDVTELVPDGIPVDTFDGAAWVSMVVFTMQKIRPKNLPPLAIISDFHEINVRTYATLDDKPGVYFINMEAEKHFSAVLSRFLSGLPYEKATIRLNRKNNEQRYTASNRNKGFQLDATFTVGKKIMDKTVLDKWLTERYCLYLDYRDGIHRYEVHHKPWDLYEVELANLKVNYKIGNVTLDRQPDLAHYSDGVKVLAWRKERIKN